METTEEKDTKYRHTQKYIEKIIFIFAEKSEMLAAEAYHIFFNEI